MSVRVPRLRPGCDVRSLPLTPAQAFLLSRIDGALSERDLAALTGLAPGVLDEALDRLRALGAIDLDDAGAAGAARPAPDRPSQPADPTPAAGPVDLDEAVDVSPEKRRRIIDLFHRLEELTHYALLGVEETADKKAIKAAYYGLAPEFHPDTYFRKQLGSYKQKIEAIFSQITLAHDVLTSKERRAEYDEYLEQSRRNRTMAALIEGTPGDVAGVVFAVPPPAEGTSRPAPARQSAAAIPALTAKERRELLARKLGGGLRRPSSMTMPAVRVSPPPGTVAAQSAPSSSPGEPAPLEQGPSPESVRAAEELKSRYETARDEAQRIQLDRYVALGRGALERKDYASAANAYRIAAGLAPDDPDVQRVSAEVQKLAAASLADGYLKQAQYEEAHERWEDAALSYAKVCAGRPDDPRPHERAAFTMLKAGGSTRRAVEFARRAVELAPESAEMRLTLARAYAVAGLGKSAIGELARAAEIGRNDARVRELIAQARDQIRHGKPV